MPFILATYVRRFPATRDFHLARVGVRVIRHASRFAPFNVSVPIGSTFEFLVVVRVTKVDSGLHALRRVLFFYLRVIRLRLVITSNYVRRNDNGLGEFLDFLRRYNDGGGGLFVL